MEDLLSPIASHDDPKIHVENENNNYMADANDHNCDTSRNNRIDDVHLNCGTSTADEKEVCIVVASVLCRTVLANHRCRSSWRRRLPSRAGR